jgi:hypothetical protein
MWEMSGKREAQVYLAEFVCGPYDGWQVAVAEPLAEAVVLPVNPNLLRRISGDPDQEPAPISTLALYCLRYAGRRNRYIYIRSLPANRYHLNQCIL